MGRSYKVTGINLKAAPLGEQDRLLTILTPERGLLRVVAGGARKAKSSLAGRSNLFVVNQLVIAPGRSLDRITQAETIESFPRFSQDLTRLTAAQYLAEVALF
ncbi:MAG: DNA repair protein RecO, partial [Prochlorothrix sp.]